MRCLHAVEAEVDGGEALGQAAFQIREASVEAGLLNIEPAIQTGNLIEDEPEIGLHSVAGSLESGVVGVGRWVGFQDWTSLRYQFVSSQIREGKEEGLGRKKNRRGRTSSAQKSVYNSMTLPLLQ